MTNDHIMIVDDEPEIGQMIRRLAERHGRRATVVTDPRTFGALYLKIKPRTVLLDIVMPYIDGLELAQWIADQEHKARVVLMSGYNPRYMEAASNLARLRGGLSIVSLTKPISHEDLLAIIRGCLPRQIEDS